MTTNDTGIDAAEAAARALLDERLVPIRDLAAANGERSALLEQLTDVNKKFARAYAAAQSAGWSADELKKLGYAEPAKRAPGRPPRTRPAATNG